MRHTRPTSVLASVLLVPSVPAQSLPYVDASPRVLTGAWATTSNTFPFARSGGLIQYWSRADNFRIGQLVTALGARPARTAAAGVVVLSSVEIKMSSTPVTAAGFSKVFASNFGPFVTTVFTQKPVSLPAIAPPYDTNTSVLWLNTDAPFIALGQNVLCQWDYGTAVGAVNRLHFADATSAFTATAAINFTSGTSCGTGALAATSVAATSYVLKLTGAPPASPVAVLLGMEHTRFGGAVPLPYRLDLAGMPGCFLGVDPLVTINTGADNSGAATLTIPLAAAPSDSLVLYAQAAHVDPTKPTGFATTNVAHSVLGTGLFDYCYNWTLDGPSAQYGPYFPANYLTVLLFK